MTFASALRGPVGAGDSASWRMHPVRPSATGLMARSKPYSPHSSTATHPLRRCQPPVSLCQARSAPGALVTALGPSHLQPAALLRSKRGFACGWRSMGCHSALPARRRHQPSPCTASAAVLSRGSADEGGGDADSRSDSDLLQPAEAGLAPGAGEQPSPAVETDEPPRSRANTAMIALRYVPL